MSRQFLAVTWSPDDSLAICDNNLESWYQDVLSSLDNSKGVHLFVATELQVMRLRVGIKEGDIEPFKLNIKGDVFHIGQNGRFNPWPYHPEFNHFNNLITRII